MRPFLWRFLDRDDDEIAAGPFRNDMGGREMSFLPAVRLFRQFSFRIVDVNRNLGSLDLGSHPKPVLVAFEKLLADGLLLAHSQIATPVILTNLESFFNVRFGRLKRERLRIVDRGTRAEQRDEKETDK